MTMSLFYQKYILFRRGRFTMEPKHNLTDISNALAKVMDNPIANLIRSGTIGVLGTLNPIAGVLAEIGNDLLSNYDTFKFSLLLKGLSSESNMEKRLNELYNYVNASPEKAVIVANLFRKTIISECPKVCVIYGLILAAHLENNTEFTQDELIVCKALENATEYDLNNFKTIMEKYLKLDSNEKRIIFPKDFPDLNEFTITCDWGVYNRIFLLRSLQWGGMRDTTSAIYTNYYETKPASVLMNYIEKATQIWNYGEN